MRANNKAILESIKNQCRHLLNAWCMKGAGKKFAIKSIRTQNDSIQIQIYNKVKRY